MNAHKKLKELGFKKTCFHTISYDRSTYEPIMVPDNEIFRTLSNEGSVSLSVRKSYPKSDSFWICKFSDVYTMWVHVKSQSIYYIWLEDKSVKFSRYASTYKKPERIKLVYNLSDRNSYRLKGINDILNLFPTVIRRDLFLSKLFS